jgi:ABC-type proline/glycine betaine transport system permease subunit
MSALQVVGIALAYLVTVYIAYGLTVWWEATHFMSRDLREMRGFFVTVWPLALIGLVLLAIGYYAFRLLAIPADFIYDSVYRKASSR